MYILSQQNSFNVIGNAGDPRQAGRQIDRQVEDFQNYIKIS